MASPQKPLNNQRVLFVVLMDKMDGLVLSGILIGVSIPLALVILVANGILDNPIP